MDASQLPQILLQACKYGAAGILGYILAEVLQLPEDTMHPFKLMELGKKVRAHAQRAGYLLIKTAQDIARLPPAQDRHE